VRDRHGVSFCFRNAGVQYHTRIARLTLIFLLSFLRQFERELIGERTREKGKKKKSWERPRRQGQVVGWHSQFWCMSGAKGGGLVVNVEEAARVQEIFGELPPEPQLLIRSHCNV